MPPSPAVSGRLLVIGNSGSGKSTLAERIARLTDQPVIDLDLVHWHEDGRKRDEDASRALVRTLAAGPRWIVEGVYGWLAAVASHRATALIWTDLSPSDCRDGLLRRGLRRGMTDADQEALLAWADAYWTRGTPSSARGHERLFSTFDGERLRLRTRREVDGFLVRLEDGPSG